MQNRDPEGEKSEKGIKNVFEEIMTENLPNLKKETDIQVQEAQRVPNKINPNRPSPMDRSSKMKINKETQALNDTLNKMDLIDIYRTFHPKATE